MNSTKLRCAELCGGFLVNLRLQKSFYLLILGFSVLRLQILTIYYGNTYRPIVASRIPHNLHLHKCLHTI